MPAPLLAVDAPSLLYRAFFALPKSIRGEGGRPVNALLGTANLVLWVVERHAPRAVVLCFGAEAAAYRADAWPGYHADRPPMPDELAAQWDDAPAFFGAFGWPSLHAGDLEADDLLGSLARAEEEAGGEALLFTGDRDMFQCASERVRVLFPRGGKDGPEDIGPAEVRRRYGVAPAQVPDFIALRGDPSDGLPGAKGIGEKTARDLLRDHGDLDALLADAQRATTGLRPRVAQALREQAEDLRLFRRVATLVPIDVERPPDTPTDFAGAAVAARERGLNRLAERLATLAA
ncbi:MAG TPA: 5'-3' exonuclease [Solirubrobacteraceae bacterium]|nr:5'-3' exonuclease [Solirubrobacteraceae bacterium]